MKYLKKKYTITLAIYINVISIFFLPNLLTASEITLEIQGNKYTDDSVVKSFIKNKPKDLSDEYSNYLLKTLDKSKLFEEVIVSIKESSYLIIVKEYPSLNKIIYNNNDRLKNEDLEKIANELKLFNTNPSSINIFIDEVKKIYESFGYNNINIQASKKIDNDNNTAELTFDIDEGKITKINNVYFSGNKNIDSNYLRSQIKSRNKTLKNIFANNNFKKYILQNDLQKISNIYKDRGYKTVSAEYEIEYLKSNKVNIYFKINEGEKFYFSNIEILDNSNLLSPLSKKATQEKIDKYNNDKPHYSISKIDEIKKDISDKIISSGVDFFEIRALEKIESNKVNIIFQVNKIKPQYTNKINIYGNSRTFDYVIRRELKIAEGDPIHKSQIKSIEKNLRSLNLFKSVEIIEKELDDNLIDLSINVEEKQTGTVNAGVSVGTLEGFAILAGLSERNFYGTGRSVKAIINTSTDKNQFTFETTDRLSYENDVDINYNANYIEEDFSKVSSYNLNTFSLGFGVGYKINRNFNHNIDLSYNIKDYTVTDSSTVADTIGKSQGENVSFLLINNLYYSTLNSFYLPQDGDSLSFINYIETPTSSSNGYIKNVITAKKYKKINKNIISNQTRIGNIISLSNNDILTDDKFSLGGRWLRGFDTFGAGPRNSRTSYVGGKNLIVSKFDYSREIFDNSDFPLLVNVFNDYGLVWDNKTTPTNNDNNIRSSIGFGLKYYSPIGPIGFSWGFPIMDEEYDIKRMFLFSVGNIDWLNL